MVPQLAMSMYMHICFDKMNGVKGEMYRQAFFWISVCTLIIIYSYDSQFILEQLTISYKVGDKSNKHN